MEEEISHNSLTGGTILLSLLYMFYFQKECRKFSLSRCFLSIFLLIVLQGLLLTEACTSKELTTYYGLFSIFYTRLLVPNSILVRTRPRSLRICILV